MSTEGGLPRWFWGMGLVFGITFIGIGSWAVQRQRVTAAWPSVEGTILRSDVETRNQGVSASDILYAPRVSYRYSIGTVVHTGTRIALSTWATGNRGEVESYLRKFAAGARVPVYYEPDDPANSIIDRESSVLVWIFIVIGSLITVATIVGYLVVGRGR